MPPRFDTSDPSMSAWPSSASAAHSSSSQSLRRRCRARLPQRSGRSGRSCAGSSGSRCRDCGTGRQLRNPPGLVRGIGVAELCQIDRQGNGVELEDRPRRAGVVDRDLQAAPRSLAQQDLGRCPPPGIRGSFLSLPPTGVAGAAPRLRASDAARSAMVRAPAAPQVSSTFRGRFGEGGNTRLTQPMTCMPGTRSLPSLTCNSK